MEIASKIQEIAKRIPEQRKVITTEEATKTAFVLPFLAALGYDVFDPTEVVPEFTADVGIKKEEKVDYAIMRDGKPVFLIECKHHSVPLSHGPSGQLYRYFVATTDTRFGVLTNGIVYRFYTDLDKKHLMDQKPFFVFDMLNFQERDMQELCRFAKAEFNIDHVLNHAEELKYTRELYALITDEIYDPSEEFVSFLAKKVLPPGRKVTHVTISYFTPIVKQAFKQVISDQVQDRLKTALERTKEQDESTSDASGDEDILFSRVQKQQGVETTEDEKQGYRIVRDIIKDTVDVQRIFMRDVQNYCGILLDDNNQKPVCRLRFNAKQKYLGLFDTGKEEQVPIDSVEDIHQHAERLKATIARLNATPSDMTS